jgi:Chaperone of endosialidase
MKTTTRSTNCIHPSLGRSALFLVSLLIACVGLLPRVQAVSPAPDGGYPGANTAEGQNALSSLTTGTFNTAVGFLSLGSSSIAEFNTAVGAGTLLLNTIGAENTAIGAGALLNNTDGIVNTATGAFALFSNTEGEFNTAIGDHALFANTTGNFNTAVGREALDSNTTGNQNAALGNFSGFAVNTANNVICIGNGVTGADVSNTCFIGNIRGVTTINNDAIPVMIDSAGQLGTMSSSARFKIDIKAMDKASESILALKPVTFHYKSGKTDRPEFGLIAEEVAKVNPDLIVHDKNGEIYTVRYEAVNAMLLNEFLKEHRKVEQLTKDFESKLAEQQKQIQQLTAGLQKVSAQLEVSEPAPQTVLNRQ